LENNCKLALAFEETSVLLWASFKSIRRFNNLPGGIKTMIATGSHRVIVGGTNTHSIIQIWNIYTGNAEKMFMGHTRSVGALLELPGSILVSGGATTDKTIFFWNMSTLKDDQSIRIIRHADQDSCEAIIILKNNVDIACGSSRNINIYRLDGDMCPIKVLKGHPGIVCSMIALEDSETLVSSSDWEDTVKFWNISTEACIKNLECKTGGVKQLLCYSADYFVSATSEGALKIYSNHTKSLVHKICCSRLALKRVNRVCDNTLVTVTYNKLVWWRVDISNTS